MSANWAILVVHIRLSLIMPLVLLVGTDFGFLGLCAVDIVAAIAFVLHLVDNERFKGLKVRVGIKPIGLPVAVLISVGMQRIKLTAGNLFRLIIIHRHHFGHPNLFGRRVVHPSVGVRRRIGTAAVAAGRRGAA